MNTTLKKYEQRNSLKKEKDFFFLTYLTTILYAIVQLCQGSDMDRDAQFTSRWYGHPKPDSNEIYTRPTRIKHEKCLHKKGVSRVPCSFQAGALLSQQKQF